MLRIKKYRLSELQAFVNSPLYEAMEVVPVSKHRVNSYINNPRANADDFVLYMAFLGDELVGYRTLLPDMLYVDEATLRVAWLSGNWVSPAHRRKGISSQIFRQVFDDWEGRLLYTNYAPESKAVYDKTGKFTHVQSLPGVRLYLRPCLYPILSKRGKQFRFLKPLWWTVDRILWLINPLPLFAKGIKLRGVGLEYVATVDDELAKLFEEATDASPLQRKRQELEWIMKFPWLVPSPLGDRVGERYFFSASPKRFQQQLVKVYKEKTLAGFIMLNHTDGVASVPYVSFQPEDVELFTKIILKHAMAVGADRLTVYHAELSRSLRSLKPFGLLSRKQYRNYFASQSLSLSNTTFLEGDGDCVFV